MKFIHHQHLGLFKQFIKYFIIYNENINNNLQIYYSLNYFHSRLMSFLIFSCKIYFWSRKQKSINEFCIRKINYNILLPDKACYTDRGIYLKDSPKPVVLHFTSHLQEVFVFGLYPWLTNVEAALGNMPCWKASLRFSTCRVLLACRWGQNCDNG